jgi:hypothetical protein
VKCLASIARGFAFTLRAHARRRSVRSFALAALAAAVWTSAPAAEPPVPASGEWNFRVMLDGKPIGRHRFSVTKQGDERKVLSEADFAVKFLGITAYRYRHRAAEEWNGDCLVGLTSTTDDDGKRSNVHIDKKTSESAVVEASTANPSSPSCLMSFAYWNPSIQSQTRLLNAQTGEIEDVNLARAGSGSVDVHGERVAATRLRITGAAHPIDVWYSARGEWVGLDSTVAGGRVLSYRLEP